MIFVESEELEVSTKKKLEEVMERTVELRLGMANVEICLDIVDEDEIQRLNSDFRGVDAVTDVLSFPDTELDAPIEAVAVLSGQVDLCPESGAAVLGDIAICLPRAKQQAEEYGNTLEEELCFLAVHGTLHLLGYDHMTEEDDKLMRKMQRRALGRPEEDD